MVVMTHAPAGSRVDSPEDRVVERALVERAATDADAFALLYRRHVREVYAFAYRRCGSREVAEEATSAAFEKALRAIGGFRWRDAGVRPWLLRIASNEVADIYRRRSRQDGARGQMALRAMAPVETEAAETPVDLSALHAALDRLSERYRAVISLRYLAGLSPADAAAEMECSTATLAVVLHRALNALRAEMARTTDHEGGVR